MGQYTWRDIWDVQNMYYLSNVYDKTSYAIQSQYAASTKILALCDQYQKYLSPEDDINLYYYKIFNILTAEGIGLDWWGERVGIDRSIYDEVEDQTLTLADDDYRLLLLYKALANISPSTSEGQNRLLKALIDTGIGGFPQAGYVIKVDTMVIRWVFEDFLTSIQRAIFRVAGTLARGAGVGWEFYAINPNKVFGFNGQRMQPFNQAPFVPDYSLQVDKG